MLGVGRVPDFDDGSLTENARSADWRLTADEMAEVDAIMGVNQPAPAR